MGNPVFSYTARDYESSRKEGIARLPFMSQGTWTDLNASDPGIVLIDYMHALVDMCNYYLDHQAMETFISTAKERANLFRSAKQLSYKVRSAKGSKVDVVFFLADEWQNTIIIPKNTVLHTGTGIYYLTSRVAYIPAGSYEVTVPCTQGVISSVTYTGTGVSRYSINVSNPVNQSVTLTDPYIDIDSIEVIDNAGILWTPVDHLVFSSTNEKVYQANLNVDDTISILFGDGERGAVPQTSDVLTIRYVKTLGDKGRVGSSDIGAIDGDIRDIYGNVVDISVINPNPSSGGSGTESEAEIRAKAPGVIKAQDRAVTLKDYENLAKTIDGVYDAKALDVNNAPDLCLYHEVKVVVTPDSDNVDNLALVNEVYDYLYPRMIPPTNLQVLTPHYLPVDIEVTVTRNPVVYRYADDGVEDGVLYTIRDFFESQRGKIGQSFYPNDLVTAITNMQEVQSVVSISPSTVVEAPGLSMIVGGDIKVHVK